MSYIFKKGDVVRYKASEAYAMPGNLHGEPDHTKEFIVASNDYDPSGPVAPSFSLIMFEGDKGRAGALASRLELVKAATKPKPEGKFAWGIFYRDGSLRQAFKTRQAARDFNTFGCYQIKKIKYEIV